MTREMTGDSESDFPPHWAQFFENMQLNCGYPLYKAFRLQWFNYFNEKYEGKLNLHILNMVTQRYACYGNPKRADKHYKKVIHPSIFSRIKKAIELIGVMRAVKNV